ncbi:MAG: pyridoxamine 5'-phosphate oxidase family protein [Pseudomonadota bacterium]
MASDDTKKDPFRPLDDEARGTLTEMLSEPHAALAVTDPETGVPSVTRIGFLWLDGHAFTLISTLSDHTSALQANPACGLMLGSPGPKGDPLTHPRLSLQARALTADKVLWRDRYIAARPKVKLYYDFTDFGLVEFEVTKGLLNGGFGKAYRVTAADLTPQ